MSQEINLVTEPATHSMHYMCQRSRIYSGHLCSTGVEKGKKNRLCYNELDSLSPAKNNAHAWADRDCHPSRQQGVALQDVSVQKCTLPSAAVCPESPAPCAAHPRAVPHTATTMLSSPFTGAPLAAWHTLSPVKTLPAALCSFWIGRSEGVHFAQVIVHAAKMPRRKWPVSHLAMQPQSHKFLWSEQGNEEKKGQRKGSTAGQSYGWDQIWLQSCHNSLRQRRRN